MLITLSPILIILTVSIQNLAFCQNSYQTALIRIWLPTPSVSTSSGCDSSLIACNVEVNSEPLLTVHHQYSQSASVSNAVMRTRIAYVRTSSTPDRMTMKDVERFLWTYVRQPQSIQQSQVLNLDTDTRRHSFYFTIFTKDDLQILDLLIENFRPPRAQPNPYFMWGVIQSDIHFHTSLSNSQSQLGRRALQRCRDAGYEPTIHGSDNTDCDNELLDECDYVIDINYLPQFGGFDWFWNHVHPGIRQDNMLTNPKYDVGRHDISKRGLAGRTKFSIQGHNSGCYHGNYDWQCYGCGGKCKRGRCKVNPGKERIVPEAYRLPEKGSTNPEWKNLTAADVCYRYRLQHWPEAPGKWHKGRDDWGSIDMFSGD